MWKKIITIIGAFVLLGGFITGGWIMDDRYAKAGDAEQNKIDIKINGIKDDIRWYQDQMIYIMTRCGTRDPNTLPEYAHRNYRNYEIKKESLDRELNILMQQRK